MTPETAEALRKPFDKGEVNQIPRKNHKTGAMIQLDYVGHASVTDRLLQVDPEWTWEPMGKLPTGAPALDYDEFDRPIGMWIYLTVCGVTKPGYGYLDQPAKKEDGTVTEVNESVKQIISDAIRNAAMRFGVALDLWKKEDKHSSTEGYGERSRSRPSGAPADEAEATEPVEGLAAEKLALIQLRKKIRTADPNAEAKYGNLQLLTLEQLREIDNG